MKSILIIGCGYTGERLARRHGERGDAVSATTRDPERSRRLRDCGVEVLPIDLDAPPGALPHAELVYYLAPPPRHGTSDPRLAAALRMLPPPRQLVYFSTTGVYGDHAGAKVDEKTAPTPTTDRARRRVDAENQVAAWSAANGVRPSILRVAGIYGPGRLPLQRLREGAPVADVSAGPGNRIHVDDLVSAAIAITDAGTAGTWNVSDGNPMPTAEFNDLVADLANLPRPRRVPPDSPELSAGARSFLQDSRFVDNTRLLAMPGFRLRYANPADGIRASLRE